jgi:hypothetical protein
MFDYRDFMNLSRVAESMQGVPLAAKTIGSTATT